MGNPGSGVFTDTPIGITAQTVTTMWQAYSIRWPISGIYYEDRVGVKEYYVTYYEGREYTIASFSRLIEGQRGEGNAGNNATWELTGGSNQPR